VFARALARSGWFGAITGVDITPAMLDEARCAAAGGGRGLPADCGSVLEFVEADAVALPFDESSFDAVVTRLSVHHLSDPERAINEMARVVKPGGRVVVVDIVVGGNDTDTDNGDGDLGGADPALAMETNRLERLRDPSHTTMLSRSDMCALLERSGLHLTHRAEDTPMLPNAMNLQAWMDATNTEPHAVQKIERSVTIELQEGGTETGMGPFVGDDGELCFTHHYAVFQATKPSPTFDVADAVTASPVDWGLAEGGNRSNIVSAGAGTSNLHTSSPSVISPEMPELEWRELATRNHYYAMNNEHASVEKNRRGEEDVAVTRKRLRWAATKRGWVECGDFLTGWVDAGGLSSLDPAALPALDRLLQCDDMFLMGLVLRTKDAPTELDTPALEALRHFAAIEWES
jgi:SAM-dependent methyltransferase/succinate dehydrogenase flavin-adding protein (antitoxin of CptAB toxin-antitoxin module)